MTPHFSDPLVTLYHGDCLEVMAELPDASVDAVVTDPPYGLKFMGKAWDHGVPAEPFWREMLRVAKPGAYLLAFGGTRTVHRIATNIEDSGWIIRDLLMWIYASGFPKGKANLKPAHEPIVLARKPGPLRPLAIDECRIGTDGGLTRHTASNGEHRDRWEGNTATGEVTVNGGRWPSNVLLSDPELFDEPNPYVVGSGADARTSGFYEKAGEPAGMWGIASEASAQYADTGGYSRFFRVPTKKRDLPDPSAGVEPAAEHPTTFIIPKADRSERERGMDRPVATTSGARSSELHGGPSVGNSVGAQARLNTHPTVKPIDLMRHLVRLVTPVGGVVLDPFLGSGTTALAASEEGFRCIGIEREAEYLDIAVGRLMATPMGLGLDHGLAGKKPPNTHSDLSKHQPKRRAPADNYSGGWKGHKATPGSLDMFTRVKASDLVIECPASQRADGKHTLRVGVCVLCGEEAA